jgi:gliding motility-associated-like protein
VKRIFYFFVVFLFNTFSLSAYHIVGGDFTYKHLSGNTFEMKLVLFRDCYSIGAPFDLFITVGFFEQLTNNLIQTHNVSLAGSGPVVPSGLDCAPPPDVCVEEGFYIWQVTLLNNPNGYYAVWERCCRNSIVTNLQQPSSTGIVFYLEMPDPALQNSSPEFIDPPLPYVCESNPFEYTFSAFDMDGDSIVYSLQTPMAGNSVSAMPVLASPLPAPYDSAFWSPGYGLGNIAGGIPITIHPQSGLLSGSAAYIGMFAMAVSVKEYRNGVKIGEVRREIEFVVLPCEQNNAPELTDTLSLFLNYLEVNPSDSICFAINVFDADSDSLFLTYSGNVFTHSNPGVTQSISGVGTLQTFFCWVPNCNDVSANNYEAIFTVKDNGCPLPKTTIHTYTFKVNEPPEIPASNLLCLEYSGANGLIVHFNDTLNSLSKYFTRYNVYRSVDGSAYVLYDTINDSLAVTWPDPNAPQNQVKDYCYYFRGVNICGAEGPPSDTACSQSNANGTLNVITHVTVAKENVVEINWLPNYDNLFSEFYIERKVNDGFSGYNNYATFNGPGFTTWNDQSARTGKKSYCYRIITKNVCGNFSQPSDEACTIFLSGESGLFQSNLSWTPYRTWQHGVADYKILRSSPGNNNFIIAGIATETEQTFIDRNLDLHEGEFVYKIKAVEGPGGVGAESYSNEITLVQKPHLYIPNAFTPNNDGTNDAWGAGSAFVEEMELKIYDRNGQLVFYTNNVENLWDGTIDGKKAPQGVYVYSLTYSGFDSKKTYTKKGYFSLLR